MSNNQEGILNAHNASKILGHSEETKNFVKNGGMSIASRGQTQVKDADIPALALLNGYDSRLAAGESRDTLSNVASFALLKGFDNVLQAEGNTSVPEKELVGKAMAASQDKNNMFIQGIDYGR